MTVFAKGALPSVTTLGGAAGQRQTTAGTTRTSQRSARRGWGMSQMRSAKQVAVFRTTERVGPQTTGAESTARRFGPFEIPGVLVQEVSNSAAHGCPVARCATLYGLAQASLQLHVRSQSRELDSS